MNRQTRKNPGGRRRLPFAPALYWIGVAIVSVFLLWALAMVAVQVCSRGDS